MILQKWSCLQLHHCLQPHRSTSTGTQFFVTAMSDWPIDHQLDAAVHAADFAACLKYRRPNRPAERPRRADDQSASRSSPSRRTGSRTRRRPAHRGRGEMWTRSPRYARSSQAAARARDVAAVSAAGSPSSAMFFYFIKGTMWSFFFSSSSKCSATTELNINALRTICYTAGCDQRCVESAVKS